MADLGRRGRDDALLLAVASGMTIRDAARQVGIGERTATRRMADPGFRQRVLQLRSEVLDLAVAKLTALMSDAIEALRKNLNTGNSSTEVRAALGILDSTMKIREATVVEERLQRLETAYEKANE